MPTEIHGVPIHPLVVHAVVVLVPLVAVGVVLIAFVPRWHLRYGVPLLALSVVAFVSSLVAKESGEQLKTALGDPPAVEHHASLGATMWIFALAQLLTLAALVGVSWRRRSHDPDGRATSSALVTALAVLAVLGSVAATVEVVRVGDAGGRAVWSGIDVSD